MTVLSTARATGGRCQRPSLLRDAERQRPAFRTQEDHYSRNSTKRRCRIRSFHEDRPRHPRHRFRQPPRQPGIAWLRAAVARRNAAKLFALVKEQGVLNTTVRLRSSQVAMARNPRPRADTAVARCAPRRKLNMIRRPTRGAHAAGAAPWCRDQARATMATSIRDGLSNQARYPPPPSRRGYDTQAISSNRSSNITTTAAIRRHRRATTISHGRLQPRYQNISDRRPDRAVRRTRELRLALRPRRCQGRAPSSRPPSPRRKR